MQLEPPLLRGTFIRRYKRFFADVILQDGRLVTAHCPNTGSMLNCLVENSTCWVAPVHNPKAKLRYRLELVSTKFSGLVGINTLRANALVGEALAQGAIPELAHYPTRQPEVRYGAEGSRIDWLLSRDGESCYLEIKNVTLADDNRIARFPDAVTLRGRKHLRELQLIRAQGHRAVLFYCVQIESIKGMALANTIDPAYCVELRRAIAAGVEVLAYRAWLNPPGEIVLAERLEFCWQDAQG